jgi:flagellar FliL protein
MEFPRRKQPSLEDLEKEHSQKKGSYGPFLFFVILFLVLVIVALSVWIWYIQGDREKMAEQKDMKSTKAATEVPVREALPHGALLFNFEPFFVPLAASAGEKNFLKINMSAELNSPALVPEIKEKMLVLRRSLYSLMSSKRVDEIDSLEGRVRLKKDIAEKMNILLNSGTVREIYFSEFIIQ